MNDFRPGLRILLLLLLGLSLLTLPVDAEPTPMRGWRTDGLGCYAQAHAPREWSPQTPALWHVDLPRSNATPVWLEQRIFLTAEPGTLLCVDAKSGATVWQQSHSYFDLLTPEQVEQARTDLAQADELERQMTPLNRETSALQKQLKELKDQPEQADAVNAQLKELRTQLDALRQQQAPLLTWRLPPTHALTGYTTATPVTDGSCVGVCFGTGIAAVHELDGTLRWRRFLEKPPQHYGHAASPVLVGELLIVTLNQLTALDVRTGATRWQARIRPRWGTPIVLTLGNEPVLALPGGELIRARDGLLLARHLADLQFCSAIAAAGTLYYLDTTSYAYALPADLPVDLPAGSLQLERRWQVSLPNDRYYASPLLHDGLLYAVTQHGKLTVLQASDGAVVYQRDLPELGGPTAYPSITLMGDVIHLGSDNGTTLVFQPGREFVWLATNRLEPYRASPVCRGDQLLLRTLKGLWCFESAAR